MTNRRSELRISQNEPALITVLEGTNPSPLQAMLVESSGHGLRVTLNRKLSPGTLVKIELPDSLILAEVCHCSQQGVQYIAGLKVDQVLSGLKELTALNSRLLPPLRENQEATSRR